MLRTSACHMIVTTLLAAATLAAAAEPSRPMLDLLPATEFGSLTIRNTDDLKQRGEALIDAVGVPMNYRPSQLVDMGIGWLGMMTHFDPRSPVAVIATNAGKTNETFFNGLVLAVPVNDREAAARLSGLDPNAGQPAAVELRIPLGDFWRFGALDRRHLLLSGGKDDPIAKGAVQSVLDGPPLSQRLTPAATARLNDTDILLHVGVAQLRAADPERFPKDWTISTQKLDPEELAIAERIQAAFHDLSDASFSIRLGDGLATQTRLQFAPDDNSASGRLLGDLRIASPARNGQSGPGLDGLPEGPVLAAGALCEPSLQRQLILRTVAKLIMINDSSWQLGIATNWSGGTITDLRQAIILGTLGEVLPLAQEARFAIYPNADGTFSTIVILDTDDPEHLVGTIRELADVVVNSTSPHDASTPSAVSDETFRSLTRQLGADDFATRSRASTRLLLYGPKVTPWLEQAAKSEDAEAAARARQLLEKMSASTRQREARLLTDNPLLGAHPQLAYHIAAERAGEGDHAIDVIRLTLPEAEAERSTQLAEIFGSEWDRIRLVRLPRQVVLTFGSPGSRLAETIDNLAHARPGLAYDPRLVKLPDDPARLMELHLPLSRFVPPADHRYFAAGEPRDQSPSRALTACGVSATELELGFDLQLPVDEVRGLVVQRGWSW